MLNDKYTNKSEWGKKGIVKWSIRNINEMVIAKGWFRKTNDTLSMQPDKSSVFFLTVY